MDEALVILEKWDKRITRTIIVLFSVLCLYGAYKFGYSQGWNTCVDVTIKYLEQNGMSHHKENTDNAI